MDRLGVGQDAVEVEEDCIKHSDQLSPSDGKTARSGHGSAGPRAPPDGTVRETAPC